MPQQRDQHSSQPPCVITPMMLNLTAKICEILATLNLPHNSPLVPHLRRANRIRTIRASLAIENNTLSLEQVSAIIEGKRVLGSPREIKEVKNAYEAYEQILNFNGVRLEDLLKAHKLMMSALVDDAGRWRSGSVGVFGKSELIHLAPPAHLVPQQMRELFTWYAQSELHPLVKSSIFHYEFEFIHPFSDGNGRMGRMWQSKLLGEWNEVFYYLPIEELIAKEQQEYYNALSQSDESGQSSAFVEFMLRTIQTALLELQNGVLNDRLNGVLNESEKALLKALKKNPHITQAALATKLGLSARSISRIIHSLTLQGYIRRVGSKKSGVYEVIRLKP